MKFNISEGVSGVWKVEKFIIPKQSTEGLRCSIQGRPVVAGNYMRLMRGGTLVMSNTPAEIRDLQPLFWMASKTEDCTVIINGLGLGVALSGLLEMKNVRQIDVVEQSQDVINLIRPHIKDTRVVVHLGNAYLMEWGRGKRWSLAWHDIWDNIPNSDDKRDITKLKRKYCHRVSWQGVWCEGQSRY